MGRRARQRALAEARGEKTVCTLSFDEKSGYTQRSSFCVGPLHRPTKTGACRDRCAHTSKNVQHHAGTRWDEKCHQARRHKQPPDRFDAQTIASENTGTRETTTPCAQSMKRILLHTSTDGERTHNNRQNARRGDVHNKNTEDLSNWHECKLDSEETSTGNGRINVRRGILISNKKVRAMYENHNNDRICSWSEILLFRKTGWAMMADCIYLKKTFGQSHTFLSRRSPTP